MESQFPALIIVSLAKKLMRSHLMTTNYTSISDTISL